MSSTRRATDGEFHQERFCSAPEFEAGAINGLAAAKRISLVKDRSTRELLWFIQSRSLRPGGLQKLCDEILSSFPDRIGTPTLRKFLSRKHKRVCEKELKAIRREWRSARLIDLDISALLDSGEYEWTDETEEHQTAEQQLHSCLSEANESAKSDLLDYLIKCCLDPSCNLSDSPWYFVDLTAALKALRSRSIESAESRLADTAVTRKINYTLDFWRSRRRMVLIEGVAGIGRTKTTEAWAEAQAGTVRVVEVPSSGDDRSFFAAIARQLGVARGTSMKAQEIKVRVEETLANSELMIAFDESQYLWGQYLRPRKTPDRILWIKTVFDSGTPIALIAHTDFSKWQAHYVAKTLWTDEQFERRLNRRISLPSEHSREDMLKIARSHFPDGDARSLEASCRLRARDRKEAGQRNRRGARKRSLSSGKRRSRSNNFQRH